MIRVFIVDDEYYIREGMKQIVPWEQLGCEISGDAESAEEAMEILNTQPADILIVDIHMYSMNGLELCDVIKKRYPNTEIIIVTGYDEFKYTQEAIRKNVVDYILKPVDEQELIRALERAKDRILERRLQDEKIWISKIEKSILNNDEAGLEHILSVIQEQYRRTNRKRRDFWALDNLIESIVKNLDAKSIEVYKEAVSGVDIEDVDQMFAEMEKFLKTILYAKNSKGKFAIIERVKQYVENHYDEKITLQVVAHEMYINASYLSNLFSEVTGVNYSDYVTSVRIRNAKKLLRTTDLSIEEISRRTGFSDSKYFSKVFKKVAGRTPRSYRNE